MKKFSTIKNLVVSAVALAAVSATFPALAMDFAQGWYVYTDVLVHDPTPPWVYTQIQPLASDPGCDFLKSLSEYTCPDCPCW